MRIETETLHKNVESRYPAAFDYAVEGELRAILAHGLTTLPQKQRIVIEERFLGSTISYRVLGRKLGYSHEYVRQLETRGLNNLKETLPVLIGMFDSHNTSNTHKRKPVIKMARKKQTNRLSREQYARMTPSQLKERDKQNNHQWYLKNKDRLLMKNKVLYREDKVYHHWRSKRWKQNNPEAWKAYILPYQKQRIESLHDGYVKSLLTAGTGLKAQDIPQKLITLKRQDVTLRRLIKNKGDDK